MKIKISFYVAISCLCLILSCSSSSGNQLKEHRIETFVVDPGMETKSMSKAQYTIDSIRPLVFPDSIKGIGISKIYDTNDRIYILDSEITKSLYGRSLNFPWQAPEVLTKDGAYTIQEERDVRNAMQLCSESFDL